MDSKEGGRRKAPRRQDVAERPPTPVLSYTTPVPAHRSSLSPILAAWIALFPCACAALDRITMDNGRMLEGRILKEDDSGIELATDEGTAFIPRGRIGSVERDLPAPPPKPAAPAPLRPQESKSRLPAGNDRPDDAPVDIQALTTEQKEWALAVSAPLAGRNGELTDALELRKRSGIKVSTDSVKEILARDWDITDRKSLFNSLTWIDQCGHRKEFEELGKRLQELSPRKLEQLEAEIDDEDFLHSVRLVSKNHRALGSKSLLGWDYVRYAYLCRCGFHVGYITKDEAWALLVPVARKMQKTFDSWQELGENYRLGRAFWSAEKARTQDHMIRDILERLRTDPESPWIKLPWELNLGQSKPR